MQRLLCEPEDRLGSQSTVSTSRPNSLIMSVRRSGFFGQLGGGSGGASIDGAEHIKVRLHVHGTIGGKMWTKADWFASIHLLCSSPRRLPKRGQRPVFRRRIIAKRVVGTWGACAVIDSLAAVVRRPPVSLNDSPTAGARVVQRDRLG